MRARAITDDKANRGTVQGPGPGPVTLSFFYCLLLWFCQCSQKDCSLGSTNSLVRKTIEFLVVRAMFNNSLVGKPCGL